MSDPTLEARFAALERENQLRDRRVRRVLVIEGLANVTVLAVKAVVGFATGSLTILGDAVHSLTDVANNIVALVVMHYAAMPPDREHPYGHRKYETMTVFVLATLLTIMAFELSLQAIKGEDRILADHPWALPLMIGVLLINVGVALWERRQAERIGSELLRADARHTFGDVATTVVVIGGWQLAAHGHAWLDSVFAFLVACFVFYLAYELFGRAIPVLVDEIAVDPDELTEAVGAVPGVLSVHAVRSRWAGSSPTADVTITVAPDLRVADAHIIADAVEGALQSRFAIHDATVHIEPHETDA